MIMKVTVVIIEDEIPGRQLLKEYIQQLPELELVGECADGLEGFKAIASKKPDLIFLDIQMPRISGLEMLELIDEENMPAVIFSTAYDEYAIRAFELNALDYLLKPISFERFRQAVDRAIDKMRANTAGNAPIQAVAARSLAEMNFPDRIVVRSGNGIQVIPDTDIHCIEANDDYVIICTENEEFIKKKTLAYYEDTLDPSVFARVHRSCIVNIQSIQRIEPYSKDAFVAILKDGRKIPVSKQGYARLRKAFDF